MLPFSLLEQVTIVVSNNYFEKRKAAKSTHTRGALRTRHFELVIEHPSRATSFPELFCHTGKKSMERGWHEMLFTFNLFF